MSRGEAETDQLRARLESQLDRLLEQLSDLEKDRADLGEEEYSEMRQDTLEQVGEFEASLNRLCSGDLGLVDSINAMQLAMQATVSQKNAIPVLRRRRLSRLVVGGDCLASRCQCCESASTDSRGLSAPVRG